MMIVLTDARRVRAPVAPGRDRDGAAGGTPEAVAVYAERKWQARGGHVVQSVTAAGTVRAL